MAGQPLGERNPKWLQDDYVKFLRLAQWKIDQAGEGIVAFVESVFSGVAQGGAVAAL
ncbi:MAG TPA: hypothetical protein VGS07_16805 [Thermoanaerobaculia bacterium]|nr:hypothetical protein [Thermoanaerobaculia bacterium]